MNPDFVHLRLHTEFSVTHGLVRIGEAASYAADTQQVALALTDTHNYFGWIKFYQALRYNGIKPLLGVELSLKPVNEQGTIYRILVLVRDEAGYQGLSCLLSEAWKNPLQKGVPLVDPQDLVAFRSHWFILSGGARGDVGGLLIQDQRELAYARARWWKENFGDSYFLELQRYGQPNQEREIALTVSLAQELEIPVVATHPIEFMREDDFKAHEARVCIAEGKLLGDQKRIKSCTSEQYFKSPSQMQSLFSDFQVALKNSVLIAMQCNLTMILGKPQLPQFPIPAGMTVEQFFRQEVMRGLEKRFQMESVASFDVYGERMEFECLTINKMGFAGYFLIVADFIRWSKEHDIPVGPGRGSGAGSLVAYSLGITDLDPLKYDLLFERFLNPERVSMPDFDVDFCQERREEVIQYVRERYGSDSVAQIATFGTMAARAVIRDVGRVLGLSYSFVDQLAKLIPMELDMTLAKACTVEPQLQEKAKNEEEVAELLELATRLEGVTRQVGMHAGGVLIAPGQITHFTPLYRQDNAQNMISQFDKDDVEKVGLVKFDFLGLKTLTILADAVRWIRQRGGDLSNFSLANISLDDPETYALFGSGDTTAVFQQESKTAKDMEKRLKPSKFEDIISLMALNRPGPLQSGMVDEFIERRHGRSPVDLFHPSLEPVLSATYGVIVYQEQVMKIAQILAGYSMGEADSLRRAMGKKDQNEMERHRTKFIDGAQNRGVDGALAMRLYELMAKFGQYGFNKSHSAAYALISFQTAWLKTHYRACYMAATLSADMDDSDKIALMVEDVRLAGMTILPPDINRSEWVFVPIDDRTIRFGLGAIKGTGLEAIKALVREREQYGEYLSLSDLCHRLDKRVVNRRVLEALIKAGAWDAYQDNRAYLMSSLEEAMSTAAHNSLHQNQVGLFEQPGLVDTMEVNLWEGANAFPRWGIAQQLFQEKSVLGFFLSGHPFREYEPYLRGCIPQTLAHVQEAGSVVLTGIVTGVRVLQTRRGRMGVVLLDDEQGRLEVSFFAELFMEKRHLLKEDQLIVVWGKCTSDPYTQSLRIIAEKVLGQEDFFAQMVREVGVTVRDDNNAQQFIADYQKNEKGPCVVKVQVHIPDGISGVLVLPGIVPSLAWIQQCQRLVGPIEVVARF